MLENSEYIINNICVKTMMILDALTPIITNIEIDR